MDNRKETAHSWLKIALKEIKARIKQLKIHDTGELYNSLDGWITELSGGDSYKAELIYNFYGIFPDMGVGKGQGIGDSVANKLAGGNRKRKPWTRAIGHESHRFAELMGESYAKLTVEKMAKEITLKSVIYF